MARCRLPLVALWLALVAIGGPGAANAEESEGGRLALFPLKRRVRDVDAAEAVEVALRLQVTRFGEVRPADETVRTRRVRGPAS